MTYNVAITDVTIKLSLQHAKGCDLSDDTQAKKFLAEILCDAFDLAPGSISAEQIVSFETRKE